MQSKRPNIGDIVNVSVGWADEILTGTVITIEHSGFFFELLSGSLRGMSCFCEHAGGWHFGTSVPDNQWEDNLDLIRAEWQVRNTKAILDEARIKLEVAGNVFTAAQHDHQAAKETLAVLKGESNAVL